MSLLVRYVNNNDMHGMNAVRWSRSRQSAKASLLFYAYGPPDTEPIFLEIIHPDMRATMLTAKGIVVGEQ